MQLIEDRLGGAGGVFVRPVTLRGTVTLDRPASGHWALLRGFDVAFRQPDGDNHIHEIRASVESFPGKDGLHVDIVGTVELRDENPDGGGLTLTNEFTLDCELQYTLVAV